jgi:dTDP-4-dehydrorhamnose reductase
VSLDSSKLSEELGGDPFAPWPADPRLVPTHQEWHFDRSGFAGSRSDLERLLYRAEMIAGVD